MTVQEAGDELDLSPERILQFIHSERIDARKIGRDWLVDLHSLDKVRDRPGPGRPVINGS